MDNIVMLYFDTRLTIQCTNFYAITSETYLVFICTIEYFSHLHQISYFFYFKQKMNLKMWKTNKTLKNKILYE